METGSCVVISSPINVVHLNARIMTSTDFGGDAFVEGCASWVLSRVKTPTSVFDLTTSTCGIAFVELGDKAGLIDIFNVV